MSLFVVDVAGWQHTQLEVLEALRIHLSVFMKCNIIIIIIIIINIVFVSHL